MKTIIFAAITFLLGCHAVCGDVCYEMQSESHFYLTLAMEDFYVASDFSEGKVLIVFGSDPAGDHWSIVDLNNNKTYINTVEKGCRYQFYSPGSNELFEQCLPVDAVPVESGSLIDFYYMTRVGGFSWLVGVTPVDGTTFYKRSVSRFTLTNVVPLEVGILYDYSQGISDPTVFNKDLSGCVEAPFES
ncbi:hypothetical protein PoB_005260000 [Plakobranchus ocellatus]|uniref:DOMON domain-containing protein n=1 Tax=Plakobranchus ocellatus TaxID=259542 RepID=A0AAV4C0A5_9GAST|nr:hypothetical protein PoB_005260000 [Plakobranchus ocellatus]